MVDFPLSCQFSGGNYNQVLFWFGGLLPPAKKKTSHQDRHPELEGMIYDFIIENRRVPQQCHPPRGIRPYSGIMVVNKVSWIFNSSTVVGPIENGSMRMHISGSSCRKRDVFQPAVFVFWLHVSVHWFTKKKHRDQWIIQVLVKGDPLEGNIYIYIPGL